MDSDSAGESLFASVRHFAHVCSSIKKGTFMKPIPKLTIATLIFWAVPASAQSSAVEISRNSVIYSSDGTKIGRVENILKAKDGTPLSVKVIYRGKFLTFPVSSFTAGEKGVTTSFSNTDIKKM